MLPGFVMSLAVRLSRRNLLACLAEILAARNPFCAGQVSSSQTKALSPVLATETPHR